MEIYAGFGEGLDFRNYEIFLFNLWFILRRIIFLFVALFMEDYPYYQIVIFVWCSIVAQGYLLHAKPYSSQEQCTIETINEGMIYMLGIFSTAILAFTDSQRELLGDTLVFLIYIKVSFNFLMILKAVFDSLKPCLKAYFVSNKRLKFMIIVKRRIMRQELLQSAVSYQENNSSAY